MPLPARPLLLLALAALGSLAGPLIARTAAPPAEARLLVANSGGDAVLAYPLGSPRSGEALRLKAAPGAHPWALAVAANGEVWAANPGDSSLARYPAPRAGSSLEPALTLHSAALRDPWGLALDRRGNLWAANTGNDTLVRFDAAVLAKGGEANPSAVLRLTNCAPCRPTALALDAGGRLWVSLEGGDGRLGRLARFDPAQLAASGSPAPALVIEADAMKGSTSPAFDARGNLWLANYDRHTLVRLPAARLEGGPGAPAVFSGASLAHPVGLAFEGSGDLWVANDGNGTLTRYPAAALAGPGGAGLEPNATVGGLSAPRRVAITPPVPVVRGTRAARPGA